MTADLFEDRGAELLARGTADPIEQLQLTRSEQDQLDLIRGEANSARTLAEVGLVLGAAILLYRHFVHRKTRQELPNMVESRFLQALTLRNARNFIPAWIYMVTPALETAYTIGSVRGGSAMIPDRMVTQFAQRYAGDIANYFNETSSQALTEGFNTYVNRKMARRMAAEKALEGFGLNSRMMRALVGRIARGKVDSPLDLDNDASTRDYIEMMLVQRAHDIGDNEGFNVSQHGQQISWLYLQKTGALSMQAVKIWLTARDERVCTSCGPMDKQAVLVNQPFSTAYGKLWVPSMHPQCRCEVHLRVPVRDDYALAKAAPEPFLEREHPRGEGGRFRTKTKEREVDPTLERLLREAKATPQQIALQDSVDLGTAPISLGEGQIELGRQIELEQRPKISLDAPQVSLAQSGLAIPAEQIVLPGVSQIELQHTIANLQQQATIDLSTRLDTPRAPIKSGGDIVDLPETVFRLDPAGFHYYEGDSPHIDPMDPDYANFLPQHEFTTLQTVTEQVGELYAREIQRETKRIMTSGRNFLKSTGYDDIVLDEGRVQLAITAEVMGIDEPELRTFANAMGVHRSDWSVVQYRMDRAYAEGYEGDAYAHEDNEFWEVPGRYRIEEDLLPREGWPVIVIEVEPEEPEEEYHRDWPYA